MVCSTELYQYLCLEMETVVTILTLVIYLVGKVIGVIVQILDGDLRDPLLLGSFSFPQESSTLTGIADIGNEMR